MTTRPKVIRSRLIQQDGILVSSNEDGRLHISAEAADGTDQVINLPEERALLLYELLPAVFEWGDSGSEEPQ